MHLTPQHPFVALFSLKPLQSDNTFLAIFFYIWQERGEGAVEKCHFFPVSQILWVAIHKMMLEFYPIILH